MPELGRDILFSIDQVAKLTGVKKSTLRYWEKTFREFLRPNRSGSRRREYSLQEIKIIEYIRKLLREEHLTNTGVRLKLAKLNGSEPLS